MGKVTIELDLERLQKIFYNRGKILSFVIKILILVEVDHFMFIWAVRKTFC